MEARRTGWLLLADLLVIARGFLNSNVSRSRLARCAKRQGLNTRPVEDKDAHVPHKTFTDYAPGFGHVDIEYLPQMADETARRYLFGTIDRSTRWVDLRIYSDQSEESSTDFLSRLHTPASMKIETILTDNDSQFIDRFTGKRKKPSGKRAFEHERVSLDTKHRLIKPRQPQTNGMAERFNGRISDMLATTRLRSRDDLQATLGRYSELYNEHLPRRALGQQTPLQAARAWREQRLELSVRKTRQQSGLDGYAVGHSVC
ncbi:MAG: integrase core domain-containing protein [Rhodanobacter sp.]